LLEEMHILGYDLVTSTDLSRLYSNVFPSKLTSQLHICYRIVLGKIFSGLSFSH
jgi:hypothetical protein